MQKLQFENRKSCNEIKNTEKYFRSKTIQQNHYKTIYLYHRNVFRI